MSKLVDTIKSTGGGASESGMGLFASQKPKDKEERRNKKDPLFGISGKRGIGPYSKQSERVQSLSISNALVKRTKVSAEKNKQEETKVATEVAAEKAAYVASHPSPVLDSSGQKNARRRTAARQQRTGGRLSTVLSDSEGLG